MRWSTSSWRFLAGSDSRLEDLFVDPALLRLEDLRRMEDDVDDGLEEATEQAEGSGEGPETKRISVPPSPAADELVILN